MHLFERIKIIAKNVAGSETKLAAALGIQQRTFNGYLNPKSQKNLWEYLPKILECFPLISREWLYFGEGDMLKNSLPLHNNLNTPVVPSTPEARANLRIEQLESQNAELTEKLFAAKDKLLEVQGELLASKDKIIALQEENKKRGESGHPSTFTELRRDNPRSATKGKPAPTAS